MLVPIDDVGNPSVVRTFVVENNPGKEVIKDGSILEKSMEKDLLLVTIFNPFKTVVGPSKIIAPVSP